MFIGYREIYPIEITNYAFGDDIVITANSKKYLKSNLKVWNDVLEKKGMKLNKSKIKIIMLAKGIEQINICIEGTNWNW